MRALLAFVGVLGTLLFGGGAGWLYVQQREPLLLLVAAVGVLVLWLLLLVTHLLTGGVPVRIVQDQRR